MLRKSLQEEIRPILLNHLKFRLNFQNVLGFSHKIYTLCKIPRVSSLYIATALIWLIFVVETQYVLCKVGNKLLNKITLILVLKSFKSMYLYIIIIIIIIIITFRKDRFDSCSLYLNTYYIFYINFCVVFKHFVLFYILFVLCCSMYCLCVNVYCTTATG
jgi:hypothetical protein